MSLSTNSTNITLITDASLLEKDSLYKIRMNNRLLKDGNIFRYIGKKTIKNNNMSGIFYYFKLNDKTDEYFGEILISLYTFEKVNLYLLRNESDDEISYYYSDLSE
jgi:hypothetical protein